LPKLAGIVLEIIKSDVDNIAVDAMQIFIDLNKTFRSGVEDFVPQYLDFILYLVSSFENISRKIIDDSEKGIYCNRYSSMSLRLLHDAPVIVVLLFQLHRKFINEYVPRLVPEIVKLLSVDIAGTNESLPPICSLEEVGDELQSPRRLAYIDFITCQVKVLYIYYFFSSVRRYLSWHTSLEVLFLH
jgi:transformation/transcription domain-associated protein